MGKYNLYDMNSQFVSVKRRTNVERWGDVLYRASDDEKVTQVINPDDDQTITIAPVTIVSPDDKKKASDSAGKSAPLVYSLC